MALNIVQVRERENVTDKTYVQDAILSERANVLYHRFSARIADIVRSGRLAVCSRALCYFRIKSPELFLE